MRRTAMIVLMGIALLVAACAADGGETSTTSPSEPESSEEIVPPSDPDPQPGATPPEDGPPQAEATDAAIGDLAGQLGVDPDTITIVDFERLTWNDGSLGCPEPGMTYTQALVPGYRILLEADGTTHAYHGADGQLPFLCDERLATGDPKPRP